MQQLRAFIFIFFIILALPSAQAQPALVDSLKTVLEEATGNQKVETLIKLSEAYRVFDFDSSIAFGQQALALSEKRKTTGFQALTLKSLGVSYLFEGKLDQAAEYFEKSLDLYTENNDLQGMANCLNNIGQVDLHRGNYDSAAVCFSRNYEIVKALDNQQDMASALIQLGNVDYYRGYFNQSLDHYYQAMHIYSGIGDQSGKADAYYSLGVIYDEMKQFEKALEYYEKAEKTYLETGNARDLSHVLNNMAKIYNFEYNDYSTAHRLYDQSLQLKKQLNDKIGMALLYNNLGTLYGNQGDYGEAMSCFDKSKALYKTIESEPGLMMVLFNIGQVYQEKGRPKKAVSHFEQSLKIAEKIGDAGYVSRNYEALLHSYAMIGNYKAFDKYCSLFTADKDSLISRLRQAELAGIETKYKVEELLRETSSIQKDNKRKAHEIKRYRLALLVIGGVFVLSLLLYFLLRRKF